MSPGRFSPAYNLGVITRETGLHPDTLRAWERRYGLPQPARSAGGQRLYSQRDLEIVKWLIAQQEAGLRIRQAADLWHHQVAEGVDPLQVVEQAEGQSVTPSFDGGNVAAYKSQWVSACLSFNESRAEQAVAEAFSQYPPETVCFDVLFAGLSEIGQSWYGGHVTVQQEHFASALVTRRLNALIAGAPPPTRPERIVIAAPAEEDHSLPSLLITYLLRRRGWDVIYLGADLPLGNFRATIEELNPHLVILTAHQLFTAASLLDLAHEFEGPHPTLAFGGLIFNRVPDLRARIPGHFLGEELEDTIPNIEQLLLNPPKRKEIPLPNTSPLLEEFRDSLPAIESRVSELTADHPELRSATSTYLSRNLLAALKLGDLSFLNNDLDWLRGLHSNFKLPDRILQSFLQIYSQAVDELMGSRAAPLLSWLQSGIDRRFERGST